MSEVTGRLENWKVQRCSDGEFIIWGHVFDDIQGRFRDGLFIHTSGIDDSLLDELESGYIAKTRNSSYLLGVYKG